MSETGYVAVPAPTADLTNLQSVCSALKTNVDTLCRARGTSAGWAATVANLAQEIGENTGAGGGDVSVNYLRTLAAEASQLVTSVSQQMGNMLPKSGGSMSGPLNLSGDPTQDAHAVPKSYVDRIGLTHWDDIPGRPEAFPPKPHRHSVDEIDTLQPVLDNLAPKIHTHAYTDLKLPEGATATPGHVLAWTTEGFGLIPPPAGTGSGGAGLWIGPSSPLTPGVTPLWFDTTSGELMVWFNDGDSTQWVQAAPQRPGPPGPPGAGIRSGAVAPAATDGRDGEFWINYTDFVVYGPKAGGIWPAGVSMRTGGRTLTMAGERVLMSGFNLEMR